MKRIKLIIIAMITCFLQVSGQLDLSEPREMRFMERQPPKQIMDSIGVKPSMTIGEIGAGRGRFTVYFARRVGSDGLVYANDISERSIDYLNQRIHRQGFSNIKTILGNENDPLFPEGSLDMAIMVWVYHGIPDSDQLLINIRKYLKPGARLVIIAPPDYEIDHEYNIDRSKPDPKFPPIRERINKSVEKCGYKLVRTMEFLPKDLIFVLEAE